MNKDENQFDEAAKDYNKAAMEHLMSPADRAAYSMKMNLAWPMPKKDNE